MGEESPKNSDKGCSSGSSTTESSPKLASSKCVSVSVKLDG